ncbi:anaerobic ribonucleoside-triphosphate reductase activating protein [bacterium]|nr:anaerobic ribonucleoside-triphosphate reductase activating protein [bacterium]
MMNLQFRGFKRLSLIDFPGKICAIGFTGGCNLRCPWCYVRDLVLNYDKLPVIKSKWVLDYLKSRKEWLDAFVVSGGEPTIHKQLPDFLRKVKDMGFLVGIETNGTNPDVLAGLMKERVVDYIEMDVKASLSNPILYRKMTGIKGLNIESIEKSVRLIMRSRLKYGYAFRTTVVPGLLDVKDVVGIAKSLKGARKYYIQQFKPLDSVIDKQFRNVNPYKVETLKRIRDKCKRYIDDVELRGI